MPRARFVWGPVSDEDRRVAAEIRSAASATTTQRHRWLDYLDMFLRANPDLAEANTDEIYSLMCAQWLLRGNQASSAINMIEFYDQFRVNPAAVDRTRQRIETLRVISGTRRMADNRGRVRPRRLPDSFLPGITRIPPASLREQNRQSFWALACVTGNRCGNLLYIRKLEVTARSVIVHWGQRKVHSNVKVEYPFSWSATPPSWILAKWSEFNEHGWPFLTGCDMASCVQRWLQAWGLDLDSTSMREFLDEQTFRPLVLIHKSMLPQEYALVMDHNIETSLKHYAGGVRA